MLVIDSTHSATDFNGRDGEAVRQVIVHYTASAFAPSLKTLTCGGVSSHYLLADPHDPGYRAAGYQELRVFRLVDEAHRAWHAGASHWAGRDNLNSRSIGIEIVNQARDDAGVFTFPAYGAEQIDVLIELIRDIQGRYPAIGPTDILGHSDIAYWRKSDPGPRLPWRCLFEAGVGAWYEDVAKMAYQRRFDINLPPEVEVERAFQRYGYAPAKNRLGFQQRVRAFQMHFRPCDYSGRLDAQTCAILYALNEKYTGVAG